METCQSHVGRAAATEGAAGLLQKQRPICEGSVHTYHPSLYFRFKITVPHYNVYSLQMISTTNVENGKLFNPDKIADASDYSRKCLHANRQYLQKERDVKCVFSGSKKKRRSM